MEERKDGERRKARWLKKKELKKKQRRLEKVNLKIFILGDEGPTVLALEIFSLWQGKDAQQLNRISSDLMADNVA